MSSASHQNKSGYSPVSRPVPVSSRCCIVVVCELRIVDSVTVTRPDPPHAEIVRTRCRRRHHGGVAQGIRSASQLRDGHGPDIRAARVMTVEREFTASRESGARHHHPRGRSVPPCPVHGAPALDPASGGRCTHGLSRGKEVRVERRSSRKARETSLALPASPSHRHRRRWDRRYLARPLAITRTYAGGRYNRIVTAGAGALYFSGPTTR